MIAEYPIFGSPFKNDEQQFFPEEEELRTAREEKDALQDFIENSLNFWPVDR